MFKHYTYKRTKDKFLRLSYSRVEKKKKLLKAFFTSFRVTRNLKAKSHFKLQNKKMVFTSKIKNYCKVSFYGRSVNSRFRLSRWFIKFFLNTGFISGFVKKKG